MKRIALCFALIVLLLCAFFTAASAESAELILPSGLKEIKTEAFYGNNSIGKVILPEEVTSIGERAFAESSLKEINLPDSISFIADNAFDGCEGLTIIASEEGYAAEWIKATGWYQTMASPAQLFSYQINNGIVTITDYEGQSSDIKIPSRIEGYPVKHIASYAFSNCNNIVSIDFPQTLQSIEYRAFQNCHGLTSIILPKSLETLSSHAFESCSNLIEVTAPLVWQTGESINSPFYMCTALKKIVLYEGITEIPDYAFERHSSGDGLVYGNYHALEKVVIPSTVTRIGNNAFQSCIKLVSINIPNSVTTIGDHAFWCCYSLPSITIPDSVTSIGWDAFYFCESLTSIDLPNSITAIKMSTFQRCKKLTSITIPDSVTSIDYGAFQECSSLTSIKIPSSVTSINSAVFKDCPNVTIYGEAGSYAETYAKNNGIPFSTEKLPGMEEEGGDYASDIITVLAKGYTPGPLLVLNNEIANKLDSVDAFTFFLDHPIKSMYLEATGEVLMIPSAKDSLEAEYQKYYEEAALVTLYYLCNGHLTEAQQTINTLEKWKELVDATEFCGALADALTFNTSGSVPLGEILDVNDYSNISYDVLLTLLDTSIGFDPDEISTYFDIGVEADAESLGTALVNSFDTILDAIAVNTYRNAILGSLESDMEELLRNGSYDDKYNEVFTSVLEDIKATRDGNLDKCALSVFAETVNGVTTPHISVLVKAATDSASDGWAWKEFAEASGEYVSGFLTEVWLPGKAAKLGFDLASTTIDAFLFDTDEIGLQLRNYSLSYVTLANALGQLQDTAASIPANASVAQLRKLYQDYCLYYKTVSSSISIGYKLIETIHSKGFSSWVNGGSEAVEGWTSVLANARTALNSNYTTVLDWYSLNCPKAMA